MKDEEMISNPFQLTAQRAVGTEVPGAMANSEVQEDTVVLLDRKGFLAKLAGQILRPITEEFNSRRPFAGRNL